MEKQGFEVELNQINNALMELQGATGDVFKILNGIMIKSEKSSLVSDLTEKKKILSMKVSSIEKQEKNIEQKAQDLRAQISDSFSKNK